MFGLFSPRFNACIANAHQLDFYKHAGVTFNPSFEEPRHAQLVFDCSAETNRRLLKLRAFDHRIITAFVISTAALYLCWRSPFSVLAYAAFIYTAAQWGLRQQAYTE